MAPLPTVELIFTACSLLNPEQCLTNRLVFAADQALTPMQCIARAQDELASWYNTHPGWRITRYRCGQPKEDSARL